jgi:monoamine oxidase
MAVISAMCRRIREKLQVTMSGLSRRSFLALTAAVAARPAFAALPASGETDIAIVGAGAAGIAAARRVAAAGKRFVLLEASDHVGGRCVTDTRTFGVPYDPGAHWIAVPDSNPVAKLAARAGVDLYPAPPDQRIRIGRRYARESEAEELIARISRSSRAIADAALGRLDVSCAEALPKELDGWRPTIAFMFGPYGCGAEIDEISAMDFAKSRERNDDAFCRQGFGTLLAKLAKDFPIEFSAPVTQINSARAVEVETPRGKITAGAVIVTASVGVLAAETIKFNPELPKRPLDALNKLRLGHYERIAVEIDGDLFGLDTDTVVIEKSKGFRTAAILANVGGTNLAYIDVGGRFARDLAARGKQELEAFALDWLAELYGSDIRSAVKRRHATGWDADPWTLGAASYATVGGQPSRGILAEPVHERIFFAGEAVHETLWGTVGGAWQSGERAADAALARLAGPPPPPPEPPKRPPPRRRPQQVKKRKK